MSRNMNAYRKIKSQLPKVTLEHVHLYVTPFIYFSEKANILLLYLENRPVLVEI